MAICEDDVDIDRDRELVRRFQAGEREAFDQLYVRYFARLTRFCARRIDEPGEAEELAQEAFARAFRALSRLSGEQRFYPWLSVIASRVCVDHYRTRSRAAKVPTYEDRGVDGGQEAVLDEVDRLQASEALHRLRPRHQDVLRLREQMGWSYVDIASHYDVSVGTVQLLLFRARHALRREFHAIAGDRLAGVPVLGLVAAAVRACARRARRVLGVADAAPAFVQPLGVLAVVVGATVLALGVVAPTVIRHPQPAGEAVSAAVIGAPAGTHVSQERAPVASEPSAILHLNPTGGADGAKVRDYQPGKDDADVMPVRVQARDVFVGADPEAMSSDTRAAADRYRDDLGVPR